MRWVRQKAQAQSPLPNVAIIVVGRNEAHNVEDCLKSLCVQDYPPEKLQIVFIDDHSSDDTLDRAKRIALQHPALLQAVSAPDSPPRVGPKKNALRYGIARVHGDVLLFTDADCRVAVGWVRALVKHFDPQTGAVLGTMMPHERTRLLDRLYWLERLLVGYTSAAAIGWGNPASACGGSLAYRRRAFEESGGIAHAEAAAGDDDLTIQAIARQGWRVRYAADPASIAIEYRKQTVRNRTAATARHQSVVAFYPLRWRIAFAASIIAVACAFAILAMSIFIEPVRLAAALCLLPTLILLATGLLLFGRRLAMTVKTADVLASVLMIPLYTIFRPLALLLPNYSWRGRTHRPLTAMDSNTTV